MIRGCDFLHHVHTVQKIRKAIGLEQNRPVGQRALFFHSLDAIPVLLQKIRVSGFRCHKLFLLVGNQHAVGSDLIVDVGDLLIQQEDLLVNNILFRHHPLDLAVGLRKLTSQFIQFIVNDGFLTLQRIQLSFQFTGGRGFCLCGHKASHQANHQCQNQHAGQY